MKISQDIRQYATEKDMAVGDELIKTGLQEMAQEFKDKGSKLYVGVDSD